MTANSRKQGAGSREQKNKIHDFRVSLLPAPCSPFFQGFPPEATP
jgi:hypothetical protein